MQAEKTVILFHSTECYIHRLSNWEAPTRGYPTRSYFHPAVSVGARVPDGIIRVDTCPDQDDFLPWARPRAKPDSHAPCHTSAVAGVSYGPYSEVVPVIACENEPPPCGDSSSFRFDSNRSGTRANGTQASLTSTQAERFPNHRWPVGSVLNPSSSKERPARRSTAYDGSCSSFSVFGKMAGDSRRT
jgi:hypothetical protein